MPEPSPPGYSVTLPVFQGPLDLLLHLIERQELDVTEVSLAQVTHQYLDYLAQISDHSPDELADFSVVAAKLLLIKSRVLLPRSPVSVDGDRLVSEEDEAGDDLVRQLLEYKRVKEAARMLQELEARGLSSYVRMAAPPPLERTVDLGDVTLDDLLAAVREALVARPPMPSVNNAVAPVRISLSDQIALIERKTAGGRTVEFRHLLSRATNRLEIIVTLLALLEMIKQLRVTVRQDRPFGGILIAAREMSTVEAATPGG